MAITGLHAIIYSQHAEAVRAFLRDELGFQNVDAGHGWLIFAMPPTELAVHPSDSPGSCELYLMCDELDSTVSMLTAKGVAVGAIKEQRWGRLVSITLPGGETLGLYEPRHPTAIDVRH